MLVAALVAFAAGATAGIFLAMRHFVRKRLPVWVALAHGLGGATGFTLVLLTVVREPGFQPARQALYLFIATIALGCVNLLFHIRRVRHRTSLIVMHALTAVSGVATLIYAIAVHEPSAAPPPPIATASAPASATQTAEAPAAPAASVPPATEPAPSKPEPIDPTVVRALEVSIGFATASAEMLPGSRNVIAKIAAVLQKTPEISLVEVQGHADERGQDEQNLELTRARAAAVVEALVQQGVERDRLRSAGYAARCPKDPACRRDDAPATCHDPARWQEDRRVVLLPLRVGKSSYQGEVVCDRGAELIPKEHLPFHTPAGN